MNAARQTDERLRYALNGDQPSRERLCLAVLALDRNYTDINPRRPEGGPDGSRDLQCYRNAQHCFGAVGFINNVSDSKENKRSAKEKFKADLKAAINSEPNLQAFVFFTNIDLTPTEIQTLEDWGKKKGLSFIDIYWRERIRQALDSPEGLAIRYQYLGMKLSDAEQASFFSRFGADIERLIRGRFDDIERKIDKLAFTNWKNGTIRNLSLELRFREPWAYFREKPEHFRVYLNLQHVGNEQRNIILGGRDDYCTSGNTGWLFDTKSFFFRQLYPKQAAIWVKKNVRQRIGGISNLTFGLSCLPPFTILVAEFEGLRPHLHITENLINRVASITLIADSYVLLDCEVNPSCWRKSGLETIWPDKITHDEERIAWSYLEHGPWGLHLDRPIVISK